MLVNGAYAAEIAAAGHGNLRAAETAQQRADQIIGCAQLVRQILGNMRGMDIRAVNFHIRGVQEAYIRAEPIQNLQQHRHIRNLRNVLNTHNAVHQKRGGDDGDRGILCAADVHLTVERATASNDIFLHINS